LWRKAFDIIMMGSFIEETPVCSAPVFHSYIVIQSYTIKDTHLVSYIYIYMVRSEPMRACAPSPWPPGGARSRMSARHGAPHDPRVQWVLFNDVPWVYIDRSRMRLSINIYLHVYTSHIFYLYIYIYTYIYIYPHEGVSAHVLPHVARTGSAAGCEEATMASSRSQAFAPL
jgi:hypothetical protein